MKAFAELVTRLDQTNKTNAKVQALVEFFEDASDEDKLWAIAMFSGRRPRRQVKTTLLREWSAELSDLPLWLIEESYHVVGDLAETLALVLPPPTREPEMRSLAGWLRWLQELKDLEEDQKRQRLISAWDQLGRRERFVFNKLITGGFRLGVSQKLMTRALARFTEKDENALAHRLMGNWHPDETTFEDLILSEDQGDDLSRPYPFYLAYQMEGEPEDLGPAADWQAEWKWDGIRSQLLFREGQLYLWSRGEELITDRFPEFGRLTDRLPDGVAIDGELLPFKDDKPLGFQVLQTRIGRKRVSKKTMEKAPVLIMAYDLLEYQGQDIREEPLHKRRKWLEEVVKEVDQPDLLRISPLVEGPDWKELAHARETSRDRQAEGLMLKRKGSSYQVGRKKGDWWKWKVDPLTVDAVMIYAQRGHGRRANLFSDYTFAVWDGDTLVPFTKAYSGLTDAEMGRVDAWIKRNTVERFGPVRSVKPELVFEIGFEGINRSKRHKSGVALRFPRMLRWRQDKKPQEADKLEYLKGLLID